MREAESRMSDDTGGGGPLHDSMRFMTSEDLAARSTLLAQIEQYYDAAPRSSARTEDYGPLTLFIPEGKSWPYYARPTLGRTGAVSVDDVDRVRERQRALRLPETFEWVAETTPGLRSAAEKSGLEIHEHPLMVLGPDAPAPDVGELSAGLSFDLVAGQPAQVSVRIIGADDPVLVSALTVPHVAFADPGTAIGAAGLADLAELVRLRAGNDAADLVAARIRAGVATVAAAVQGGTALSAGQHLPVGAVSEIVGVGTLPVARRRGLGLAVTAALAADARSRGVEQVFMSADDDDVARIYARLGFRRVGTALVAEPAH